MDNLTFTFVAVGIIVLLGWGILYYQERKSKLLDKKKGSNNKCLEQE